jgi:dihydroneopterin aldolase
MIALTGIKAFGYHGVFDFEARDGQDFFIDVEMQVDLTKAAASDDLADTVDYGAITDLVVADVQGERVQLIEKLASRLADLVLAADKRITAVAITVHKPSAPVSSPVKDISVRIEKSR